MLKFSDFYLISGRFLTYCKNRVIKNAYKIENVHIKYRNWFKFMKLKNNNNNNNYYANFGFLLKEKKVDNKESFF